METPNWFFRIIEQHPHETAAASAGSVSIARYMLFDPDRHSTILFAVISYLFTLAVCVGLPAVVLTVDWTRLMDWGLAFITKLIGAAASGLTTYALYKKLFKKKPIRRRRIRKIGDK